MYLEDVIASVNQTHAGLGELVAMCQLSVTAHKIMLIISPSGCGKSTAMRFVGQAENENTLFIDRTSAKGLMNYVDELTASEKLIIVDDLSSTQTPYARGATMTALTALCYTHHISSAMGDSFYSIDEFYGSVLVGAQPIILKELLLLDEWEGSIRDKVIRYYHLRRPIEPYLSNPICTLNLANIESVDSHEPDTKSILWRKLWQLALMEFSRARAKEHILDLLRASAALDKRTSVIPDDYEMIAHLLSQCAIEVLSIRQEELEGNKELDRNLLYCLVQYYTYGGQFSLAQLAIDYHLSVQQCYKIMKTQAKYWDEISKSPTLYRPTKFLVSLLKKYDLEVKD